MFDALPSNVLPLYLLLRFALTSGYLDTEVTVPLTLTYFCGVDVQNPGPSLPSGRTRLTMFCSSGLVVVYEAGPHMLTELTSLAVRFQIYYSDARTE